MRLGRGTTGGCFLFLLGTVAGGCGSGDEATSKDDPASSVVTTPDGAEVSAPVTYESLSTTEICPAFIEDACRAVFLCPDLAEVTEYKNEEECRKDVPCRGLSNFETESESGYFSWDAKKAAACHDFLNDDLCAAAEELVTESLQGVLALCPESPVTPIQAEGAACLSSLACPVGTYCASDDQCGGICVPAEPEGASCDYDRDCAGDLPCEQGRCGVPPGAGEPCPDFVCERGSSCEVVGDTFESVCVLESVRELGEPCGSDWDCTEDRNCLVLGRGPGISVTIGDEEDGICSDPVPAGGGCSWTSDCATSLACVDGICDDEPVLGETCDSFLFGGHDCAAGFICDEDVCKTERFWGESCGASDQICAEGLCEGGVCVQRKPLGAACERSNDCQFRRCDDGICVDPASCAE